MQLVSRKVLDDLCLHSHGQVEVVENELEFSYDEFKAEYAAQYETARKSHPSVPNNWPYYTYDKVKTGFLKKHCPPIKYVAEGSSRAAFACVGGKCLKVAKKPAGIAQNKQEIKNISFGASQKYSCFPRNFGYDEKYTGSILTECCALYDEVAVKKLYGFKDNCLGKIKNLLNFLSSCSFKIDPAIKSLEKRIDQLRDMQANSFTGLSFDEEEDLTLFSTFSILLKDTKKPNPPPEIRVVKDLIQFYVDHGGNDNELLLDDLGGPANWGMAYRDSVLVPVIIDAGFSTSVSREYYSKGDYGELD